MSMQRLVSIIALLALVAGCGDSGGQASGPETPASVPVAEQPEPSQPSEPGELDELDEPDEPGRSTTTDSASPSTGPTDAWDPDRKARVDLPDALRSGPMITSVAEFEASEEDPTPTRAQWFGETLVHLRPDGVTAYDPNGSELWSWVAPVGIDDLDREGAVLFEDNVVLLTDESIVGEELVGLDLATGEATTYGPTTLGRLIGTISNGVWGLNPSGDFEGVVLTEPLAEYLEPVWHVDTQGPIGFSDRVTVTAFDADNAEPWIDEVRWFDLELGTTLGAPAPTVSQAAVEVGDDEVYAIAVGEDGNSEFVAYELDSAEVRWSVAVEGKAEFGAITPVNQDLVALAVGSTTSVYDAATGAEVWREEDGQNADHPDSLFVENTPGAVVALSTERRLYARDVSTGELLWVTPEGESVRGQIFTSSSAVYVVTAEAEVVAYDLESGEPLWTVEREDDAVISVAISDGAIALTTQSELIVLKA